MPDAAEIVALVLELLHLDHLGKPVDSPDERVLDRLAHATGEGHEPRGIELLVAEEDDLVLEKCFPNFTYWKFSRQVDAENLGAERSRQSPDFEAVGPYCSTLMFWLLMMEP
jgi:hypothetical protein